MSLPTLIDSNIAIDIREASSAFHEWAVEKVASPLAAGQACINPIIHAEVAAGFADEDALEAFLPPDLFEHLELPYSASFPVSRAYLAYRRRGGTKTSPMPDFYIGAHALVTGMKLLTRDVQRFRTYFPRVELIMPPPELLAAAGSR